jgi:hypothetical protein
MSSHGAAGGPEDLERARLIRMGAEDTFDGHERVMSRAAYDLQVRATAHSASCGHPGFVPDGYLSSLRIETTITAAELCTCGLWERAVGGYRVLDWEAVEVCLDQVRQISGQDRQAPAPNRECQAQAQMAEAMTVTPPCAVCRTPSARIELVAPGGFPAGWDQWPGTMQGIIVRERKASSSGNASQDSGTSCSKALPPKTATATPSTPPGPGRSPRHSGLPSVSPKSAPPGSTTTQDSARTATPPTATSTGTLDHPGNLGGSDTWEDSGPWRHSGSIRRSCVNAR